MDLKYRLIFLFYLVKNLRIFGSDFFFYFLCDYDFIFYYY